MLKDRRLAHRISGEFPTGRPLYAETFTLTSTSALFFTVNVPSLNPCIHAWEQSNACTLVVAFRFHPFDRVLVFERRKSVVVKVPIVLCRSTNKHFFEDLTMCSTSVVTHTKGFIFVTFAISARHVSWYFDLYGLFSSGLLRCLMTCDSSDSQSSAPSAAS